MTFPTGTTISTANVDSPDDDPSLARSDIEAAFIALNAVIASANTALGVLVLDSTGKIPGSFMPAALTTSAGSISLQPANGIINVNKVLRLTQIVTADLGTVTGTTAPSTGDLAFLTDGDAGEPCLAVYSGAAWRVVRLMTTVGDVGAALTSAFTITATAVP
jgi:hypothetical protein